MASVTPLDVANSPERKEKLRGLILLLLSEEDKTKFGIESDAELDQWWKAGTEHFARDEKIPVKDSNQPSSGRNSEFSKSTAPQLNAILRECVLSHRWQEAAYVLTGILRQPKSIGLWQSLFEAIHKVGLEVFYQSGQETDNHLQQLMQKLKNTIKTGVNVKKIILDYVLYLLKQNKTNEAKNELQSVSRHRMATLSKTPANKQIDELYRATQGLVHYMEWLVLYAQLQTLEHDLRDDYFTSHSDAVQNLQDSMKGVSAKAVSLFKVVCQERGTWDICIVKLIQMLEYYEETEELESVLKDYAATNTDNPNALKYLLHFFQKYHKEDKQLQKEPLQKLYQLIPSDEMSLDYYDILRDDGTQIKECTEILFSMLDYQVWQCKPQPWEKLARQLVNMRENEDEGSETAVECCWVSRASWWPSYHFHTQGLESRLTQSVDDVLVYRAVVAACLTEPDNQFTRTVEKYITEDRHRQILQRILDIPRSPSPPHRKSLRKKRRIEQI